VFAGVAISLGVLRLMVRAGMRRMDIFNNTETEDREITDAVTGKLMSDERS
jgi:uncharacterized protein YbaA (DUF1428 family)